MLDETILRSRTVMLSSDAADEFQSWWLKTQWDAKLSATGRIAGAIGKLDGITLRIAQVLEFLAWAWSVSNQQEPEQISLLSVMRAIRVIEEWVRPNLDRVFAEASLPKAQRDAMVVGRWLLKTTTNKAKDTDTVIVNARDLRRQPGFPGPKDPKELDAAIEVLIEANWLAPIPTDGAHRPRKDYIVNKAIYDDPAGR
jgi:hypothetical protein